MFVYTLEKELHEHLVENFSKYFSFEYVSSEYRVDSGIIDIIGKDEESIYIVELKRDKIDQNSISQLNSYIQDFSSSNSEKNVVGVAVAPKVKDNLELPQNVQTVRLTDVSLSVKSRAVISVDNNDAEMIKRLASKDNRNVSNYMQVLIKEHIERMENAK